MFNHRARRSPVRESPVPCHREMLPKAKRGSDKLEVGPVAANWSDRRTAPEPLRGQRPGGALQDQAATLGRSG